MSYEIKTIYRAAVPRYEGYGLAHQGWYWDRATAERIVSSGTDIRGSSIWETDVVVMDDGDVLWSRQEEDPEGTSPPRTIVTKIRVYGDSDDEVREATLARLADSWKRVLGLPHDPEVAAMQPFQFSEATDEQMRNKLLTLDVTGEEARVLGLGEERDRAVEGFKEACRLRRETAAP